MIRKLPNYVSLCLLKITSSRRNMFWFSFVVGLVAGAAVQQYQAATDHFPATAAVAAYDWAYERWLASTGHESRPRDPDLGRYGGRSKNDSSFEDRIDPETEAGFLYARVRVHCLVLPSSLDTAASIRRTWGKHCNNLSFFSEKLEDEAQQVRKLPAKSSFGLLCKSFHEIVNSDENFDWILVTTDDTFAIPENLRYFVAPFNASEPHYLGHAMKFWNQVYNWGDAGYTLSRAAVQLLLTKFDSGAKCETGGKYWKQGDWYLGKHLAGLGVAARDTRDHAAKSRFNGYSFRKLLFPGGVSLFERYWRDSLYLSPDGPKCCSNHAVTFHGLMSLSKMHQLEYLFYHLRPFPQGGTIGNVPPPPPKADPFLTEEERLKAAALDKWFSQFLTTPKNMHKLMEESFRGSDDIIDGQDHHHHI